MAVKDLLVHVDTTTACAKRVRAALELARRHGGQLTGVYVREQFTIPPYAGVHLPAELLEAQQELSHEQALRAEAAFHAAAAKAGMTAEWQCITGEPIQILSVFARQKDLTVVGQMQAHEPEWLSPLVADRLALEAGAPLLIIPNAGEVDARFGRILVAWNGSREASRALRDALPLLTLADEVRVATVSEVESKTPEPSAADIVRHLALHAVQSEVLRVDGEDSDAGTRLASAAEHMRAHLIVMGAYGRSRFRELVLGGATRHLMYHSTVPVLMSH